MTDSEASAAPPVGERVVVITGSGQGIGAAFARHLSSEGWRVAVLDLNEESAKETARQLGGPGIAVAVDVSDEDAVARAYEQVIAAFGRVDALINNAAIFSTITMRRFEEIPVDEWDAVMAVNVKGVYLCCREFTRNMRERGYGKIVNISSGTVPTGRPYYMHYVASKGAVEAITKVLANELGSIGIRANAIAPGSTETEVPRRAITPEIAMSIVSSQAIKRRQTPADLVGAAAFLVGPESDFMTGQTLIVDGGVVFN
jgi:3-oxoacyl-[acyl-carrier protein] reductase